MKQIVKKGATSNLFCIFIQDSSSTTGAGLTGLTSGSSGLVCYRARADDGNAGGTAISLSAGTKGTWSSGGFVEKDATNMPGVYELGVPDAVFATGSNYGIVMLKGATNMAPVVMEFELIAADVQDSVHLGLTSLPNVASGSAGAIPTTGTGSNQISVSSGQVILQSGTGTGQLDFTSGVVKANLAQILGTALTETAGQIAAAFKQFFDIASPTGTMKAITNVVTTTNLTTNNDKTGYSLASPPGIRKNVALAAFEILMTDSTNHNPLTGATVAVTRSVDGAAFGAGTIANIAEIANGWYKFDFGAGDLNGTNIAVRCTATGADDLCFTIHTDP